MVPRWLADKRIEGKKLSGNGILAYVHLALRGTWNPGTGEYEECRPSMKTLSSDMDVAVNTARNAVQELTRFGGVIGSERFDERGNQLPTVYRVIFGRVVEPASETPPPKSDRGGTPKNDRGVLQNPTGAPLQKTTDNQEPFNQEPNTKRKKKNVGGKERANLPAVAAQASVAASRAVLPLREDVEQLCQHLAAWVVKNGSKEPKVDKRWRDAARLMLDSDGREFDKAWALIDWCQASGFWRANIRSMSKFRDQYDAVRLQALAEWEAKKKAAERAPLVESHGMMLTQKNAAMFDMIDELRAEEAQANAAALPDAPVVGWMRELEGAR